MLSDIKIARSANKKHITDISKGLDISPFDIFQYGDDKAKINPITTKGNGKVVIVTAISPTPAGEGKSTTTIGLGDALNKLGKKTLICLREPSLGPVFGLKGGACGGGYNQVIPMEDINLHFTGDMHAITTTNNLICAVLDNYIYQDNPLNIDPNQVLIKRVMDMNDRTLRDITIAQGSKFNGVERKDGFEITVASELMAILCLSKDEDDFINRVENIEVAKTFDNKSVFVKDLNISGSIMSLMKDCLKPNLVQTLENNPVLIHGGPFANIAHGCNSIIATNTARNLADIVVTEAGFGSDLGYEKFIDIKSRLADFNVDCAVLVATIRALKYQSGISVEDLNKENVEALKIGFDNLLRHVNNIRNTNVNCVVSLNVFSQDSKDEINTFKELCSKHNIDVAINYGYSQGSDGALDLANLVIDKLNQENITKYNYNLDDDLDTKINNIIKNVYGGNGFIVKEEVKDKYEQIKQSKLDDYFICMAKTPKSFSDDESLLNAPNDFDITITDFKVCHGSKFIICYANKIMTMPGLNKEPNATKIKYHDGIIDNLS